MFASPFAYLLGASDWIVQRVEIGVWRIIRHLEEGEEEDPNPGRTGKWTETVVLRRIDGLTDGTITNLQSTILRVLRTSVANLRLIRKKDSNDQS